MQNTYMGGLGLEILQEGGTTSEATQAMMTGVTFAGYRDSSREVLNGTLGSETLLHADFVEVQVPRGSGEPALHPAGAT